MKMSLQYHATVEENIEFLRLFTEKESGLFIVEHWENPRQNVLVESSRFFEDCFDTRLDNVIFSVVPPVMGTSTTYSFLGENPDCMSMSFGRICEKGLPESGLSFITENLEAIGKWKSLAVIVKKFTKAGMTAVSPISGASVPARNQRYSSGAADLYRKGVPLLPVAGTAILKINE